ncbi:SGNH/GDSL hydrolase family protein [candidate division KSB1 bacterium]|nr:SGNH/GDSL hydrolase family protein [candidate division KSB1 bacterium]
MNRKYFLKYQFKSYVLIPVLAILMNCVSPKPVPVSVLKDGQQILFIGDSITQDGTYIDYIETFLSAKYPDKNFNILDLGLSSETVCGLTEPGHPYPRPNVHERLQRVLERTDPDIVVACYGMNDGIYSPLSEDRFKAFQDGILKLINKVKETGAQLYLLTPPPYDPVPVSEKVVDENAPVFGYATPFKNYDQVLKTYGEWIMGLQIPDVIIINIHKRMSGFITENRKTDPEFYLARDGVHPGPVGHWLMAQAILEQWGETPVMEICEINAKKLNSPQGDVQDIKNENGEISFSWKTPVSVLLFANDTSELLGLNNTLIGQKLLVKKLKESDYKLFEREREIASLTGKQLEDGIDLSAYLGLSVNKRGVELLNTVRQKRRIYDSSLLKDIGHLKPTTTSPMAREKAEEEVKKLRLVIKETAYPVAVRLRLVPVNDR